VIDLEAMIREQLGFVDWVMFVVMHIWLVFHAFLHSSLIIGSVRKEASFGLYFLPSLILTNAFFMHVYVVVFKDTPPSRASQQAHEPRPMLLSRDNVQGEAYSRHS